MKKIARLIQYPLGSIIYCLSFLVPKKKNIWIFGAWYGQRYADNSKYLFEYLNRFHPEINALWITRSKKISESLINKGYRVYNSNSIKGIYYQLRAKVAVVSNDKDDLNKYVLGGKIIVQLWHGIPLKKIEYDDKMRFFKENNKLFLMKFFFKRHLFPFLIGNYNLVIATAEETKRIFSSAFRINRDKVKITGYPRNDVLFKKRTNGIISYKYNVIYMPTVRRYIGYQPDLFGKYGFNTKRIEHFLKTYNANLFIKLHPVNKPIKDLIDEIRKSNCIKFLEIDDAYPFLHEIDLLITDYSGIYFDYLLLNRPIIFAPFDLKEYSENERKFYFNYNEITPGPKATNWNEVLKYIKKFIENPDLYKIERYLVKKRIHKFYDGNSCKRVFHEITKIIS